jgi:hypothetical protein
VEINSDNVEAELLKREPGGVKQLDSAGRLPLHVAAANTSNIAVQLVECALKGYKYACMERDREGRFPVLSLSLSLSLSLLRARFRALLSLFLARSLSLSQNI